MQIILNEDVKKLGYRGEVVNVKPGYFRNFLQSRGIAVVATPERLKLAESRKEKMVLKREQILKDAKEILKKLKGLKIIIKAKVSAKGKLYGAINVENVLTALEESAKVKLEKSDIKMDPIKDLGEHKVQVHLRDDLEETITVTVEAA